MAGDLRRVRFQSEMAGIEKMDLGIRQIALIGLGAGWQEEGIVLAPPRVRF